MTKGRVKKTTAKRTKTQTKSPGAKREQVIIFDTTLRDGEQSPGCSMNIAEKIQIAEQLARLHVDVIEAGFPISSPGDFEAVNEIARTVGKIKGGPIIAGLARAKDIDIERCGEAIKPAGKRGRIHTFIATSDIHMREKLRMGRPDVIRAAVHAVELARSFTPDVEFSLEDAGRTDWKFMVEVVEAAIAAGAKTINIPDTVGYCNPWEFGEQIAYLRATAANIDDAIISVHCHNDLGLAVINSLAAVRAGARQVECTVNGIGERAGNASLEEIVMNIATRSDFFPFMTRVNTKEIYRTSRLVATTTGSRVQANKAVVGGNAFAHEAGIHQDGVLKHRQTYEIMHADDVGWTGESMVMGKHSGRHALGKRLEAIGHRLSKEDLEKAYERFKMLCDKKKVVYDEDLHAIIQDEISDVKRVYEIADLQFTSGTAGVPTATVKLNVKGKVKMEAACGDGPVDAICRAIDRIAGKEHRVEKYELGAVTEGQDALGQVTIRVSDGKRTATGRGASTDVVVASAKAYVDAINHLLAMGKAKRRTHPQVGP
ncbi:2-isopropylmalate synthase [Candidatus Sumerlaeota bacterium]|nr:2-isopropylmalate synthase [Candidatus Sumerlaeota bacterium]